MSLRFIIVSPALYLQWAQTESSLSVLLNVIEDKSAISEGCISIKNRLNDIFCIEHIMYWPFSLLIASFPLVSCLSLWHWGILACSWAGRYLHLHGRTMRKLHRGISFEDPWALYLNSFIWFPLVEGEPANVCVAFIFFFFGLDFTRDKWIALDLTPIRSAVLELSNLYSSPSRTNDLCVACHFRSSLPWQSFSLLSISSA